MPPSGASAKRAVSTRLVFVVTACLSRHGRSPAGLPGVPGGSPNGETGKSCQLAAAKAVSGTSARAEVTRVEKVA